jgi:hypothetical protein
VPWPWGDYRNQLGQYSIAPHAVLLDAFVNDGTGMAVLLDYEIRFVGL